MLLTKAALLLLAVLAWLLPVALWLLAILALWLLAVLALWLTIATLLLRGVLILQATYPLVSLRQIKERFRLCHMLDGQVRMNDC